MELTKGEFSQFTTESRLNLLAMKGVLVAQRSYDRTTCCIYKIFDFYVSKTIRNKDNSVGAIEIISEDIVQELFSDC
jgi:hypothetical protein